MQNYIESLVKNSIHITNIGQVASYIPELSSARKNALGICVLDKENMYKAGDYLENFTIQSISKIITLMLAILDNKEEVVFSKVGVEPSGDPFNSITKLETSYDKKPFNPMINAGAITVASMIKGANADEKFNRILNFFKEIVEDDSPSLNTAVYESENKTGNKNRGMAYYLKNDGIIQTDVEEALQVYFRQCSINVNAYILAKLGLFLANNGKNSKNKQIISPHIARIVKGLMITCGTYDMSGEVAIKIGLPCKSGVGGGLVSLCPNRYGIGIYGPSLDFKGNSIAGISMLTLLSQEFNLSIF